VEFTSAKSREGTTQTVTNLAVSVARAGQRVILVDANLRSPAVHRYFNLPNDVGFTSVVVGDPLSEAFQTVPDIDNLYVLTSGPVPPNPSELLASGRCRDVLNSLKADGTLVLVDTSALLPVTDAAALAASVDMVVLVTKARASARRQLRHAVQLLQQLGAPLAGVVLTRAGNTGEDWGGSYRWQRRARVAPSVPRDAAANE
jgi:capsular exopolysaccharide synthesis family protein